MREILFRGKKQNGEWLQGDLVHYGDKILIFSENAQNSPDYYEVKSETVAQFTGLKDKNGVKIFEGDIVKANFPYAKTGFVEFDKKRCSFYVKPTDGFAAYDKGYKMNANKLEIISNIHDNPGLLK